MASKSGVIIISYSPSAIAAQTQATSAKSSSSNSGQIQISTYNFNISVEGQYPAIVNFLRNIEANLRPMKISKAELAGGDGNNPVVIASFNLETYYQQ